MWCSPAPQCASLYIPSLSGWAHSDGCCSTHMGFYTAKSEQMQFISARKGLKVDVRTQSIATGRRLKRKANTTHIPAADYLCGIPCLTVQHLKGKNSAWMFIPSSATFWDPFLYSGHLEEIGSSFQLCEKLNLKDQLQMVYHQVQWKSRFRNWPVWD